MINKSMKIIVIGNGSTVLCKENGHKIDGFDYVVRMGRCKIKGHEKYTGTKTDMFRVTWKQLFHQANNIITYIDTELTEFKDILFTDIYDYDNFTETENFFSRRIKKPRFVRSFHSKKHNMARYMHDRCLQLFMSHHPYVKNVFYCNAKGRVELIKAICKDDSIIKPTNGILTLDFIINKFPQEEIYVTGYDGSITRYYFKTSNEYGISHNNINELIYLKQLAKTGKIKYLE
jgi:hypothetical protein